MKPRGAPLAAVEDLDRDHEGTYAVPRDNVAPGTKVRGDNVASGTKLKGIIYAVPRDNVAYGTKLKGNTYAVPRENVVQR